MKLNNITVQNFGSALLLYCKGKTDQDAYEIWLDLLNFGTVGFADSQPEYVATGMIAAWTNPRKLKDYLLLRNIFAMSDNAPKKGVKGGVLPEARALMEKQYAELATESHPPANVSMPDAYEFGRISDERPDMDFKDECLKAAFSNKTAGEGTGSGAFKDVSP